MDKDQAQGESGPGEGVEPHLARQGNTDNESGYRARGPYSEVDSVGVGGVAGLDLLCQLERTAHLPKDTAWRIPTQRKHKIMTAKHSANEMAAESQGAAPGRMGLEMEREGAKHVERVVQVGRVLDPQRGHAHPKFQQHHVHQSCYNLIRPTASKNDDVALVFKVVTKPRIEEIRFNGNNELSDKKLLKSITAKVGELYDEAKVKSDIIILERLYLEKGFWNSGVTYQVLRGVEDPDKKILSFFIEENELRKIRRILFSGNIALDEGELLDAMETAPWRFWRFWSKRSKYLPRVLDDDIDKILKIYRDEGFLDIKIDQSNLILRPTGSNKIDLQISVTEGTRSYFGTLNVFGQAIIDSNDLLARLAS